MLSRFDGVGVRTLGQGDMEGFGDADETADRAEPLAR